MALLPAIGTALSILELTGLDKKLGKLIAGDKGGKAAEKVVDIAQRVTGATDATTVVNDIQLDDAAKQEVKKALIDQETEIIELALADRADAREMQRAALKQSDPVAKRFIYYFAWFWSLATCLFLGAIIFCEIPEQNIRFADNILGFVLGTIIATILQFFYGSMLKQDAD